MKLLHHLIARKISFMALEMGAMPWWMGKAYTLHSSMEYQAIVMPFHWPAGWLRWLWWWFTAGPRGTEMDRLRAENEALRHKSKTYSGMLDQYNVDKVRAKEWLDRQQGRK